jgi:hypothetical protein
MPHKEKAPAASSIAADRAETSKRDSLFKPSAARSETTSSSKGLSASDSAEIQELRQQVSTVKSDLEWSQETIKDLESALEAKEEELAKAVEVSKAAAACFAVAACFACVMVIL